MEPKQMFKMQKTVKNLIGKFPTLFSNNMKKPLNKKKDLTPIQN